VPKVPVVLASSALALGGMYACAHLSTKGVPQNPAVRTQPNSFSDDIEHNSSSMLDEGRNVFRHETFGDEVAIGEISEARARLHQPRQLSYGHGPRTGPNMFRPRIHAPWF
jgi:hypothetical protein